MSATARPLQAEAQVLDLEALRESEERFRRTFELAGCGLAHIGLDRRFLRVNRRLCEILGYPEAELLKLRGKDISHPDDADVINRERPRLYSGESTEVRLEKRYLRKDGRVVWVQFAMVLERYADGRPKYEIAVYEDITAKREAEEALRQSEERFRRTFELASSGLAHVGLDGRFVRVNPRLCEIFGYTEAELCARTVREVSHPEDRDLVDPPRSRLLAGEIDSARLEKRYIRKDGRVVWMAIAIAMERDAAGRPLYAISVLDDVTERKQAEAALREAHEELKRSHQELEQFAYVASHDLQEPLRMISSYTQLLGRRYAPKLDADANEFMRYIVDGVARMKQLIEDLLAYSRLGSRAKERKTIDLSASLARALANLKVAIEESGASVTHDAMPPVQADDVQIAQVFQNLVGNALKFRSAAAPRIHVGVAETETHVEISVRDNGIGIEPQYFERIFTLFQRLHNQAEYPGTGLGLAIVKKVVERHGGHIRVESKPGQGSAFIFTLPRHAKETGYAG